MSECRFCGEKVEDGRIFCGNLCSVSDRARREGRAGMWRLFVRGNRYHCPYCEFDEGRQRDLRNHLRVVHGVLYHQINDVLYRPDSLRLCATEGCTRVATHGEYCDSCRKEKKLRQEEKRRHETAMKEGFEDGEGEAMDEGLDALVGARMVVVTEEGPSVHGFEVEEAIRLLRLGVVALAAQRAGVTRRVRRGVMA